jgi:hypothetical protein
MSVPTKKVKMKGFPDPVTINAEDFDEKVHKEVTDDTEKTEKPEEKPKAGK